MRRLFDTEALFVSRRARVLVAAVCLAPTAHAADVHSFAVGPADAVGADGRPNVAIYERGDGGAGRVVVEPRASQEPRDNLTGFSHLRLSPDGRVLYFQAHAWVTSDAIHAVDLATLGISFVAPGELTCVLASGRWRGDLVLSQHRYDLQVGSHEDFWLYQPTGREIGLVRGGEDATGLCVSLEDDKAYEPQRKN